MNNPAAVIAEDEPLLRQEIREALTELWPALEIRAEVGDGPAAIIALTRYEPQILFLDIEMPGLDGLAVAQAASGRAHVVFITAFNQHATAAFEQGALDYVLKPVSIPRLAITVKRLQERLRSTPADLSQLPQLLRSIAGDENQYLRWITVPHGGELKLVTTDEICYLRAEDKYTTLYTAGGSFLLTSPLKAIKEKLDPRSFWQIHRGVIVNVAAIHTIHRSFRGTLEVQLKQRPEMLPVSAAHAHLFKQL